MTDSPLDLDALQRLADEATPGPWEQGHGWVYTMPLHEGDNRLASIFGMNYADPARAEAEQIRGQRNAEFVAAARSAVPALIDRVRQLEQENSELRRKRASGGIVVNLDPPAPQIVHVPRGRCRNCGYHG